MAIRSEWRLIGTSCIEVWRGDTIESRHRLHIAVYDGSGVLRAHSGNPQLVAFARSAIKPLQALPLIDDDVATRYGFTDADIALACASHSGEIRHVEGVRAILGRLDLDEDDLACGAHEPFNESAARELRERGESAGRVHNNCSGKHAGMLALACAHGWQTQGYHEANHPVQQRMLRELSAWSNIVEEDIGLAVDGCGVATFALPIAGLALAFARLAESAREHRGAAARVVNAMVAAPEMVGGTGRLCTEMMRVTNGRVFAKVGAEGLYCAGVPGAELGIAIKVEDGAKRAAEPALVAVLHVLGLLTEEEMAALEVFGQPRIYNTRREEVGEMRANVRLETHSG
jgi:L-asparaginase II